jgi:hypothetical protein
MTWKDVAPAFERLTKKLHIRPENPFSDQPTLHGIVTKKPRSYKGPSEGVMHEIGHLMMLRLLNPDGSPRTRMQEDPTEQIDVLLRRRDAKISDDQEVYVLAIEKRFAKKMGLKLGTSNLVGYAFLGFRFYEHEQHYRRLVVRVNRLAKKSKIVARHTRRLIKMVRDEIVSPSQA